MLARHKVIRIAADHGPVGGEPPWPLGRDLADRRSRVEVPFGQAPQRVPVSYDDLAGLDLARFGVARTRRSLLSRC